MELYVKNISVSQLWTLHRDEGQWVQNYLLWEYDNTVNPSAAVWIVAHKFVEILLRTKGDENKALQSAYWSIYDLDWETYIIDTDKMEKSVEEMKPEEILWQFRTKKIDFWKSWSKEKLLDNLKGAINGYLSERIQYWDIVWLEQSMEYEITEKILDKEFSLPVPMKAIADQICRLTEDRQIVTPDKEVITIPAWSLYLEDTKFKAKYSDVNMDDPKYFFQAFFLYYTSKRQYWEAPAFINFREIKTSKNRDGSSQHQVVTFLFSWEDFEIQKTYFWRFLLASIKKMEFLQENDVVYNVFDFINWGKAWEKQRAFYMQIQVKDLKTRMSVSNRSKESWNNFGWHSFNLMDKWKEIKNTVVSWEAEIEDTIRAKLLEFWLPVQYEKTNQGYAYNQILFTPGRWVEMSKLEKKLKELQQATWFEQIRVEAPVSGTKYVWIEYPREDRKYLEYSKYKKKVRGLKIPVWNALGWKTTEIDLTDSNYPHLLVAWTTWSGKSEWLKVAIESLIWKCSLWLIDPKMVEFAEYEKKASKYLVWEWEVLEHLNYLFWEMKKRYQIMKDKWVKDIAEYNKKTKNKLERIVVIIDEFWDLKHSANWKEIEKVVEQITALWRAAWIHMIIATQRPDVQIINGRIRNNITVRICLKVASDIDSKVILWKPWAEHLLGKWDLIFKDWAKSNRLQSFFIPREG